MSLQLNPAEILEHLKELGYNNVSPEQLCDFIKDLKKLIKYDNLKQERKLKKKEEQSNISEDDHLHFPRNLESPLPVNIENQRVSSAHSTKTESVASPCDRATSKKKFIDRRPKGDPVALYHYYQNIWSRHALPGEDPHSDIRWNIRNQLRESENLCMCPCCIRYMECIANLIAVDSSSTSNDNKDMKYNHVNKSSTPEEPICCPNNSQERNKREINRITTAENIPAPINKSVKYKEYLKSKKSDQIDENNYDKSVTDKVQLVDESVLSRSKVEKDKKRSDTQLTDNKLRKCSCQNVKVKNKKKHCRKFSRRKRPFISVITEITL